MKPCFMLVSYEHNESMHIVYDGDSFVKRFKQTLHVSCFLPDRFLFACSPLSVDLMSYRSLAMMVAIAGPPPAQSEAQPCVAPIFFIS